MKEILFSLVLLVTTVSYSQSLGDIPDAKLWLKPDPTTNTVKESAFNFNPVIRFDNNIKKEFRNIYKKDISLFLVFISNSENEIPVLTLKNGNTKTFLTNKSLYNSNEYLYKKVISNKGILVTYLSSGSTFSRKSKINIETALFDASDENNIMELICFDRVLNNIERAKVETYLSIKYGTSILGDNHYINSSKDTLWNSKKNKIFNNHVTGIGRDDMYGLYQKQSGNSQKDGLYIGMNTIDLSNIKNKAVVADKFFMLWGHNGKNTVFLADKDNKNHKLMKRIWKLQRSGLKPADSSTLKLRINKIETNLKPIEKGKSLWLAISQNTGNDFVYTDAKYYKQTNEDSLNVEFDSIPINAGNEELFTFIEAPDFFFEHLTEINGCDMNASRDLKVRIIGGTAPYKIDLSLNKVLQSVIIYDDIYEFKGLSPGDYTIKVTESRNQSQEEAFAIPESGSMDVEIEPMWILNENGKITIYTTGKQSDNSPLKYEWYLNGELKSTENIYEAQRVGDYIVNVYNGNCEKHLPFTVTENAKALNTHWAIYPNPVKHGEPFTIQFGLARESDVTVSIYSIEGKLIIKEHLGLIKNFDYISSLTTSGVYSVTIQINSLTETSKIIVK